MIDVSIIVVSYNTKELTLACLKSIYEQTKDITFEVIIIDNNSFDATVEAVKKQFPSIVLIEQKKNLGFAKANNVAVSEANGKYVLLLNPDTVVLARAIDKLHAFATRHPECRVYGGRTLFQDYSLNPTSCWRKTNMWSLICYATGLSSVFRRNLLFDPESYGSWQRDSVREVDIVTGCFLMIEKKMWDQLGGFNPLFFMYGEDADLCFRASLAGAKPVITPGATIIHYCGASEKVHADKMVRLLRAKGQLIKMHWSTFSSRIGILLLRSGVFLRMLVSNILSYIFLKRYACQSGCWNEIWRRRDEWNCL